MYAFIHQGSGFTGALNYILDTDGHNNKTVRMLASEGVEVKASRIDLGATVMCAGLNTLLTIMD